MHTSTHVYSQAEPCRPTSCKGPAVSSGTQMCKYTPSMATHHEARDAQTRVPSHL